jgi:hypothetical protein
MTNEPEARIGGMVFTDPPQYMLSGNPFSFMDEFEKWFWYECEKRFHDRHWFAATEIPTNRCKWKSQLTHV